VELESTLFEVRGDMNTEAMSWESDRHLKNELRENAQALIPASF
jgi:hypothetical protein